MSDTPVEAKVLKGITQQEIDQRVFDLYDEYCHGRIGRREFLSRAAAIAVVGGSGLAMAEALLPRYAQAQTISFTDTRLKGAYVTYPSPGGNSGTMRGYLVQPSGTGPFPAVLVIHENRGLNPYIEDVARRLAVEGFLALAPDGALFLGLKVGRRMAELVLVDFQGQIRQIRTQPYAFPHPDRIRDFASAASAEILADLTAAQRARQAGMGIAIPYYLWDWGTEMEPWRGRDLRAELAQRLGMPDRKSVV